MCLHAVIILGFGCFVFVDVMLGCGRFGEDLSSELLFQLVTFLVKFIAFSTISSCYFSQCSKMIGHCCLWWRSWDMVGYGGI